jgi:hypothetical protein
MIQRNARKEWFLLVIIIEHFQRVTSIWRRAIYRRRFFKNVTQLEQALFKPYTRV